MKLIKSLAMILFVIQIGISNTYADETIETNNQYSGLPIINFYLSDEQFLIISVNGLLIGDTQGFTWNDIDISELMQQYQQSGIIELSERTDGFDLKVNVDVETLGEANEFGILYIGNNKLSSTFNTANLLAEYTNKGLWGFGIGVSSGMYVYGHVRYRKSNCFFFSCKQDAPGASVSVKIGDVYTGGKGNFEKFATTDNMGNYSINFEGCGTFTVKASYSGKTASTSSGGMGCTDPGVIKKQVDIDIK